MTIDLPTVLATVVGGIFILLGLIAVRDLFILWRSAQKDERPACGRCGCSTGREEEDEAGSCSL